MALVWEKLTSEEDIAYFHSFEFKSMVATSKLLSQPLQWGVDRERDIRVVAMDGLGRKNPSINGMPLFTGVIWKGKVITIESWREIKGDTRTRGQSEYWWQIEDIRVPLSLATSEEQSLASTGPVPSPLREEVLDLVKECMIMVGTQAFPAKSADFDYIKGPRYYKD